MCAYSTINEKVLGSTNVNERKILASDVNQIREVIQTGAKDLKTGDIAMVGNTITADNGQDWIRRSSNKFQYYDAGSWKEPEAASSASFTAGENIAIRDVVYVNTSDGKIYKASSTNNDWIGIAKAAITSAATGEVYTNGDVVGGFSGLTSGTWYGVGATAGALVAQTTPDYSTVGIAISATQIKIIKRESTNSLNIPLYAILYNRMEHDTSGTTQIDPSIQSDQFCDADGRYNTVCVTGTNSSFNSNTYNNCNILTNPTCNCISCNYTCICTCVHAHPSYVACCWLNCLNIELYSSVRTCTTNGAFCSCGCLISCMYDCNLVNYSTLNKLVFIGTYRLFAHCIDCSSYMCSIINFNNCCLNNSITAYCSGCKTGTICHEFLRTGDNCFCYSVNGSCICSLSSPSLQITNSLLAYTAAKYCCGCTSTVGMIENSLTIYTICNTYISTNLKNYATSKNAVMLVTNSVLPAGNCVRYDILNQDGCTYLSDAEPDKVYNLCTNDSCCFYAVIKQNIECNLCTPQCMYGYALKMM